jgi:hypothetical protein
LESQQKWLGAERMQDSSVLFNLASPQTFTSDGDELVDAAEKLQGVAAPFRGKQF